MNRIERLLCSTKTMTILLVIFASSMAVATFVENDFDTSTAKILIYNARWFEILMLWIILIFIFNIKIYNLTKREKWPILAFHVAFIMMFIGGTVTRYFSFEGQMPIQEGTLTNQIISDLTYIKVKADDGKKSVTYEPSPYMMSYLNKNGTAWPFKRQFTKRYTFANKSLQLRSVDFIPLAKDSIQKTTKGGKILTIITTGPTGRAYDYIQNGEVKTIGDIRFSYNNPIQGTIQLTENGSQILFSSSLPAQYLSMQGQQKGIITDTGLLAERSGTIKANELTPLGLRTLYTVHNTSFIIPNYPTMGKVVYYSGDKSNLSDKSLLSLVMLEISSGNKKDTALVQGGKGITAYSTNIRINGMNIAIGYGSKIIETPFSIRCDDFRLERYPGSNNPSAYESTVTTIDNKAETPHHIYMNNVMDYKGYRFFQSSYFPDESGTILSVNKDWWGTRISYTGYFFLFLGMLLTLFRKRTRLSKINQRLKDIQKKTPVLLSLIWIGTLINAQSLAQSRTTIPPADSILNAGSAKTALGSKPINPKHAAQFEHLLVQDFQGRIKPMDTHTLELLRKIYKKDRYHQLSPVQWFLSMQLDPAYWFSQPMIYVGKKGGEALARQTGADKDGYTTFANLTDTITGEFRLQNQYNASFSKRKAEQSNFDKEFIGVTERYNIFANIIYGYFTRIIPVRNDPGQVWRSWIFNTENNTVALDSTAYAFIAIYFNEIKQSLQTGNWEKSNEALARISNFQKKWGKDITPSELKVDLEIIYNHTNLFLWLMIVYSLLGFSMIAVGFAKVLFSTTKLNHALQIITKLLLAIMILALVIQFTGLGVRWYLSGHAPWSNGYEAIIFISAIGVLAGLLLYKNRNAFIPAAGALVAMIMMGFAHGGSMLDPQITPLEPVLKSYWLMVHVGIITSSYGFFGLSALISVISLTLFSIKPNTKSKNAIQELTIVNEIAAEIGLFALTIGTFLGGIWANESWGRYWSWDPKETWAFISVIFYAVILHFRLVPGLRGKWIFNMAGMWMIWTIIFTYFGVNYYLSGLHSYAAGDPVPIPIWIPITLGMMLLLSATSFLSIKKYSISKQQSSKIPVKDQ